MLQNLFIGEIVLVKFWRVLRDKYRLVSQSLRNILSLNHSTLSAMLAGFCCISSHETANIALSTGKIPSARARYIDRSWEHLAFGEIRACAIANAAEIACICWPKLDLTRGTDITLHPPICLSDFVGSLVFKAG